MELEQARAKLDEMKPRLVAQQTQRRAFRVPRLYHLQGTMSGEVRRGRAEYAEV